MKTSKADNKKVKDIIRKAKGLSRKQAEILATIPPNVLYTLINTMSQLVSQNEPELKEGKLVARAREQVSFVLKKLEDEIHRRIKKDKKDGLAVLNRVGALVNMKVTDKKQQRGYLFLKLSECSFNYTITIWINFPIYFFINTLLPGSVSTVSGLAGFRFGRFRFGRFS